MVRSAQYEANPSPATKETRNYAWLAVRDRVGESDSRYRKAREELAK